MKCIPGGGELRSTSTRRRAHDPRSAQSKRFDEAAAALDTIMEPMIGIKIIIFDGYRQPRAKADEVNRLQKIFSALPEPCARAKPRC